MRAFSGGSAKELGKAAALTFAAFAMLIWLSPSASAHADLSASDPPDRSTIVGSPGTIRLWFDEGIDPRFSAFEVFDHAGEKVEISAVGVDGDGRRVEISVPDSLPQDVYAIRWEVLSEDDGHIETGTSVFRIDPDANSEQPTAAPAIFPAEDPVDWSEAVLHWALLLSIAIVVGSVVVDGLVLCGARGRSQISSADPTGHLAGSRRRVLGLAQTGVSLALVMSAGLLIYQAGQVGRGTVGSRIGVLPDLLTETRWGLLWGTRTILLAVLFFLIGRTRRELEPGGSSRGSSMGIWLVILALAVAQAMTGHAAESADPALSTILDAVHLMAAAVWVGGMVAMMVAFGGRRRSATDKAETRGAWRRFGWLAGASVGLLAVTGLFSAGQQVPSRQVLVGSGYGRAITGKMVLLVISALLGAFNHVALRWRRRGGKERRQIPLRAAVALEVGVASLALLLAGAAASTPAPAQSGTRAATDGAPSMLSQARDDLLVTLSASPNTPGDNLVVALVSVTERPITAEVQEVRLKVIDPTGAGDPILLPMREVVDDRYQAGGDFLYRPGRWRFDVYVTRRSLRPETFVFDWEVGTGAVAAAPIGDPSEPDLSGLLVSSAVILMFIVGATLAMAWIVTKRRREPTAAPEIEAVQTPGRAESDLPKRAADPVPDLVGSAAAGARRGNDFPRPALRSD